MYLEYDKDTVEMTNLLNDLVLQLDGLDRKLENILKIDRFNLTKLIEFDRLFYLESKICQGSLTEVQRNLSLNLPSSCSPSC